MQMLGGRESLALLGASTCPEPWEQLEGLDLRSAADLLCDFSSVPAPPWTSVFSGTWSGQTLRELRV